MDTDHLIEITSDYGHIGCLWWINSATMWETDWYTRTRIRWWGSVIWDPRPWCDYRRRIERERPWA